MSVEESDTWSEEDRRDVMRAGMLYAETVPFAEEEHDA